MIYSLFDPVRGDFRYFEANDDVGINADQPVPSFRLGSETKLGVSSLVAGRPLPSSARPAGRGPLPKGRIARSSAGETVRPGAASRQDPSGLGSIDLQPTAGSLAVLAMGATLGFVLTKWIWK